VEHDRDAVRLSPFRQAKLGPLLRMRAVAMLRSLVGECLQVRKETVEVYAAWSFER
jgi:hypothetical protein